MISLKQLYVRYDPTVWIMLFGELATNLTGSMLTPFLIFYLQSKLGGTVLLPMVIVGLQPLADILVTLLGGGLADRFGRKPVVLLALGLQAAAMLLFIRAETAWQFAPLYMANGVGRSLLIPALRAQITDVVPEKKRAEVFALLSTVGYASMTAGPFLGMMAYRHAPTSLFACQALAMLAYLLLIWWKVPETAAAVPAAGPEMSRDGTQPAFSTFRAVMGLMLFSLPVSFFYAQTETNFPLYLKSRFPDFLAVVAGITSIKAMLAICLELWLVKRTANMSDRRVIAISYTCYAVTAFVYAMVPSFPLLAGAQLFIVLGESIGLTRLLHLVAVIAPRHKRGRFFALYGMHWDISRTLGPAAGGIIMTEWGGEMLFGMAAAMLLLGGIGQSVLSSRRCAGVGSGESGQAGRSEKGL